MAGADKVLDGLAASPAGVAMAVEARAPRLACYTRCATWAIRTDWAAFQKHTTAINTELYTSPPIRVAPHIAVQCRIGAHSDTDADMVVYARVQYTAPDLMPTHVRRLVVDAVVGDEAAGGFRFAVCDRLHWPRDDTDPARPALWHSVWFRSYNWHPAKQRDARRSWFSAAGDALSVQLDIVFSVAADDAPHDAEGGTAALAIEDAVGAWPDAALVLADGAELAAHSRVLARSPVFAAQFGTFAASTDARGRRVELKDVHPAAARALLFALCADPAGERALARATESVPEGERWAVAADVFSLADRHFQLGLMRAAVRRLTAAIPPAQLARALALARFDGAPASDAPAPAPDPAAGAEHARVLARFRERIAAHVGANAAPFLVALAARRRPRKRAPAAPAAAAAAKRACPPPPPMPSG
jgi:hypothetical protein